MDEEKNKQELGAGSNAADEKGGTGPASNGKSEPEAIKPAIEGAASAQPKSTSRLSADDMAGMIRDREELMAVLQEQYYSYTLEESERRRNPKVEITVEPLLGNPCVVKIGTSDTIDNLMAAVEAELHLGKESFKLTHAQLELQKSKTVNECGLRNGSRVMLVPTVTAGSSQKKRKGTSAVDSMNRSEITSILTGENVMFEVLRWQRKDDGAEFHVIIKLGFRKPTDRSIENVEALMQRTILRYPHFPEHLRVHSEVSYMILRPAHRDANWGPKDCPLVLTHVVNTCLKEVRHLMKTDFGRKALQNQNKPEKKIAPQVTVEGCSVEPSSSTGAASQLTENERMKLRVESLKKQLNDRAKRIKLSPMAQGLESVDFKVAEQDAVMVEVEVVQVRPKSFPQPDVMISFVFYKAA